MHYLCIFLGKMGTEMGTGTLCIMHLEGKWGQALYAPFLEGGQKWGQALYALC